jgi:hypothetical protein
VLAASRVRRWWRCSRTSRQAAARTAQAPGVIAQRQVGVRRPSPGGRALFHSATPPGPQSFGKRQRPGCRGPGPLQTAEAGSGEPLPNTGLGGFIWVVPELAKGQTRQPSPGRFGEQTFFRPVCERSGPRHPLEVVRDHLDQDPKRCSRCGETSPLDRFPANSKSRDGLSSWCRRCHAAAVQRWRDENPGKAASYKLARRVQHEPRPCIQCGEPFVPRRSDAQICSDLCRWRRSRRQRKAAARRLRS